MGCTNSVTPNSPLLEKAPDEDARNSRIDAMALNDYRQNYKIQKLLLLGPGESGKSTFLKQIVNYYGEGYDEYQLKKKIPVFHSNIVEIIQILVNEYLQKQLSQSNANTINELNREMNEVGFLPTHTKITAELAKVFLKIWNDKNIQEIFTYKSKFQFHDNAKYLISMIDRVHKDDFLPTFNDILQIRSRTTGIISTFFTIQDPGALPVSFNVIDVGGQRSERRKWIHCFQGVAAIIFVTSLSEYNQLLFEDNKKNRLEETLELWYQTVNNEFLQESCFLLFLNKNDIFREKIKVEPLTEFRSNDKRVPLAKNFKKYDDYYDACIGYILKLFIRRCKKHKHHTNLYHHVTVATDTENAKKILISVKTTIISKLIGEIGLVVN